MNELFTDKANNVLKLARESAYKLNHGVIGTAHLLLGIIKEERGIGGKALRSMEINYEDLFIQVKKMSHYDTKESVNRNQLNYTPRAEAILINSTEEANRLGAPGVGTEHLLLALIRAEELISSRILTGMGVSLSQLRQNLMSRIGISDTNKNRKNFKKPQPNIENATTPTLDSLARDLTFIASQNRLDPLIGRGAEIERLIQILSRRTKSNPVLVGDPGVGKTAIIEGLAQKVVEGNVPIDMQNKRIMMLDMGAVVAGTKYRGEFEDRMKKMMDEIRQDGQIILFIDEFHTLIGAGGAEGAIDASNILKPALARGELQMIGATTLDEYQKYIEKDAALERRFAKILVDEPSVEETVQILEGLKDKYERFHHTKITAEATEAAVKLSHRYITDRKLPDKAIDLMDEAAAKLKLEKSEELSPVMEQKKVLDGIYLEKRQAILDQNFKLVQEIRDKEQLAINQFEKLVSKEKKSSHSYAHEVTEIEVAKIVSQWTGVPLNQLEKKESKELLDLEKHLHERVIGQEEAIQAISKAIRRSRSGLKDPRRPIGSFMFLGPTGVGKTELAKTVAEIVFGSEDMLIRIDMSEFMEKHSTSRLVGSPPGYVGYDEGGQLTERIRQKPYSVILLDEIEKAHPDVFNILLQVLDDGHLTDSKGRIVDFKNTIIIMTSNIGATALRDEKKVGFGSQNKNYDHKQTKSKILEELKKAFRPEFLNRLDETIVFHSLEKDHLNKIVKILVKDVTQRLTDQSITLKLTPAALEVISKVGFDPEYGARPIKRAIQKEVEDRLSDLILSQELKPGQTVTLGAKKGVIVTKIV